MSNKPRVFVAGAWSERELVQKMAGALTGMGLEVVHDWPRRGDLFGQQARRNATVDVLQAIRRCELVWVMTPESKAEGSGAWADLGMALMADKPVIISGEQRDRNAYCAKAVQTFVDHESALHFVAGFAHGLANGRAEQLRRIDRVADIGGHEMVTGS